MQYKNISVVKNMFKFFKNIKKHRKLELKLKEMEFKAAIEEKKALLEAKKTKKTRNKWDRLHEDYDGMQQFAEKMAADYDKGGVVTLMENPMVQQLIKEFAPRFLSGNAPQTQQTLGKEQNGINPAEIYAKLPPEAQKAVIKAAKSQ